MRIRLPAADLHGSAFTSLAVSCVQRLRITSATFRRRNAWTDSNVVDTPKGLQTSPPPRFLCLPLLFMWWPRYLRSESGRIFIRSSGRLIWTADSPLNLTHMQLSCFGALAFFLTWTSRQPMRICSIERISDTWRWDSHVTSPFFLNNWIRLIRRRNGTNGNDWNTQSADCVWRHLPLISGLMKRFTSNDVSVSLQSSQQTSSSWIVVRLDAIVFSSVKLQLVRLIWCKKIIQPRSRDPVETAHRVSLSSGALSASLGNFESNDNFVCCTALEAVFRGNCVDISVWSVANEMCWLTQLFGSLIQQFGYVTM